jgi:hypothetical protein
MEHRSQTPSGAAGPRVWNGIDVRVGDFNGDGSSDIAGRVSTSGDWWVAESTGTAFANSKWTRWSSSIDWVNVGTGDFNGDGNTDFGGPSRF